MNKSKIKYCLGIDGGGTKTEFLLTDIHSAEIKRLVLGSSNPVNEGLDAAKAILKEGIHAVCGGIDLGEISVFAGIAGGGTSVNKKAISDFLGSFGFGAFSNGSDTDSVLQAALKGENGVAVIMGTGIVAFSQSDGECHRTGGRGYMIDKGGSGFHFGSDALNSAFEYLDGRGGSRLISELTENRLEKNLENSVADIYAGGAAYVASFAPVVFEAYKQGDNEAERIIDRNIREAAKIINTARSYLKNSNEKTVICGGLCRQKEIIKPFILKYIDNDSPLIFSDEPMVNGAAALAKSNIHGGEKHA